LSSSDWFEELFREGQVGVANAIAPLVTLLLPNLLDINGLFLSFSFLEHIIDPVNKSRRFPDQE